MAGTPCQEVIQSYPVPGSRNTQCPFVVGPPSQTSAQQQTDFVWMRCDYVRDDCMDPCGACHRDLPETTGTNVADLQVADPQLALMRAPKLSADCEIRPPRSGGLPVLVSERPHMGVFFTV